MEYAMLQGSGYLPMGADAVHTPDHHIQLGLHGMNRQIKERDDNASISLARIYPVHDRIAEPTWP